MPESTERGALTEAVYYILLSLLSPLHGYGIMQNIERLSLSRVRIGAGTLYGALNALLEKHWIQPHLSPADSRKKEYVITDLGRSILAGEVDRLRELLTTGEEMLLRGGKRA